jgi:hypothetical protein
MNGIHVLWNPLNIRHWRGFSPADGVLKSGGRVENNFRWAPAAALGRLAGIGHTG